jgi:hypothetical protein
MPDPKKFAGDMAKLRAQQGPYQSWAVEIQVFDDREWYGNAVRFEAERDAYDHGTEKVLNWTQAERFRVVPSRDPVNRSKKQ